MENYILIRGGGDLASGVALRLHRSGYKVLIAELPKPMAVRRTVSFSEAVYEGEMVVEGLCARRVDSVQAAFELVENGMIPVIIDPEAAILQKASFSTMIDARLLKLTFEPSNLAAPLVIGLGPGFTCGENCHAVVETQRGHFLGRVYWNGSAIADTGQPEGDIRRVLRSPIEGVFSAFVKIGDLIETGQIIAEVGGEKIIAPFGGILRGLIRSGVHVPQNTKIGDIDQRCDPSYCYSVSDKALSVGGGVLEAVLFWNNRTISQDRLNLFRAS